MLLREQYQEHSERDYLSVPLATYHFEQVTIPLHWHREVELILPQEAGELELEGQLHPYGPQELLCVNQGVLHRTWAPIPLADLLGVTVTELLLCRRCPPAQPITPDTVEQVVKTAITYPDQKAQRAFQVGGRRKILWFLAALAAGAAGLYGCRHLGGWTESLSVSYMLAAVFGAYFWLLVPMRLPDFYDQHRISFFYDMTVRMSIPGLALNNRNWPAIVVCIRVWACLLTAFLPLLHLAAALLAPASWLAFLDTADLILLLGGLFVPLYIGGKK